MLTGFTISFRKKWPCSEGPVSATNPAVSFSRSCPYINCLKLLQEFFRESDNLIECSVSRGILAHFPQTPVYRKNI